VQINDVPLQKDEFATEISKNKEINFDPGKL